MKEFSKVQASRMNIDISTFLVLIRQILDTYVSREETVSLSQMYMFEKPFQILDGKPIYHIIQVSSLL